MKSAGCTTFLGVSPAQIQHAFSADERVFGRQEVINVDGKEVTLILVKNPVGLNQVLDMILTDPEPFSFGFLLNANYADGIDTSWIWDGDFERLHDHDIPYFMTGGERYKDITTRMEMAGIDKIATYTAVLQLRKLLADKKYIQGGMD